MTFQIIYQLAVDRLVGAENTQTWALGSSVYFLTDPHVKALAALLLCPFHALLFLNCSDDRPVQRKFEFYQNPDDSLQEACTYNRRKLLLRTGSFTCFTTDNFSFEHDTLPFVRLGLAEGANLCANLSDQLLVNTLEANDGAEPFSIAVVSFNSEGM
jgi:hypothetical protein